MTEHCARLESITHVASLHMTSTDCVVEAESTGIITNYTCDPREIPAISLSCHHRPSLSLD
jgi:hypothetical protein